MHVVGLLAAHGLHILQTSHANRVLRTGPQAKPVQLAGGWIESVWLWAVLQVRGAGAWGTWGWQGVFVCVCVCVCPAHAGRGTWAVGRACFGGGGVQEVCS